MVASAAGPRSETTTLVNPILAIGQLLVSIALMAAILLQARGAGLSGTFGGDSAVYRSRRGVEKRLWQFTIVLLVLFVIFSIASYKLVDAPRPDPSSSGPRGRPHPCLMTRRDSALVLALVASLAIVAVLVGAPAFQPAATPAPTDPPVAVAVDRPYREGVLGHPESISPLTARSQADRDLVALLFAGLVRNGPNGSVVPDLASRWSTSDDGRTWTFELREDAFWHDGQPVTAADVSFTIHTLQDPDYAGPRSTSWSGVTVQAVGERTVRFTLDTPIGGFLQAATQPIAPAHLLADVPVTSLPDHSFGERPVGSGPFALVSRERDLVVLRPAEAPERRHAHGRSLRRSHRLARDDRPDVAPGDAPSVPRRDRVPLLRGR